MRGLIEHDVGGVQVGGGVALFVCAAQHGAYACGQLAWAEGLRDVVVRAQFEAEHAFALLDLGGKDDDGRIGLLAVHAHKLVAAHLRHHQVKDDEVGTFMAGGVEGFLSVCSGDDAEALLAQIGGDQVADFPFVVDHQECLRHVNPFYGPRLAASTWFRIDREAGIGH